MRANTFNVNDVPTLKSAINMANINAQDDIIEMANGIYTLTARDSFLNGLPQLGADGGHKLTIHGNGATIQRVPAIDDSAHRFRIFEIKSGANVTLTELTLNNGNLASGTVAHGGAIYNNGDEVSNATLTIANCTITNCSGDYGGAIYNDGSGSPSSATLIISNSTFSGNFGSQYGGAIWNDGSFGSTSLNVSNSTFTQNSANLDTGAIQHDAFSGIATGSITNCTFDHNSAGRNGGAIYIDGEDGSAMLSVINCTFSQNTASTSGGGIYNTTGVDGGVAVTQIANTIFKTGVNGANIVNAGGTVTSLGHNLSNDNGSGFLTGAGDQISVDPMLNAAGLQNNGGPSLTIALLGTSTAINAGNDANAPGRDQRYYARSGVSDIGAFEFGGMLAPISAGSDKMHGAAGVFGIDLPLTGPAGVECRSGGVGGNHQLVIPFATPVTISGASVTSGVGSVGSTSVSGSQVTVNLTGVTNAQQIVVGLSGVNDGVHTNNASVAMRVLLGDTNGNGAVNASDVSQTKSQLGQLITNLNFRTDVNVSGSITASDVSLVKSQIGTSAAVDEMESGLVRDFDRATKPAR